MGRQAGALELLLDGLGHGILAAVALQQAPELPDQVGIGERPVAVAGLQSVAGDQAVEVVPGVFRKEPARQAHGTQHVCAESLSQALKFVLDEAIVETGIVGDEESPLQARCQFFRHLGEGRGIFHHLVADAGELLDELGDGPLGIDQGAPGGHPVAFHLHHADLGDAVDRRVAAGGFKVDEGQALRNHRGHGQQKFP